MDIGNKIKQLRILKELTQEELAFRCDLTKGFISKVERNLTSPSIATLMDILEVLGTDLKTFFDDAVDDKIVYGKEDIYVSFNEHLKITTHWLIPNSWSRFWLRFLRAGGRSRIVRIRERSSVMFLRVR